ncbi:2-dehydropantoate 2-reductase [Halopseudomonas pelagia]|uniref:2-dehydropantoate 2-reductase n=1 Tax=Halopseudomonas pelagia TaxID=553151 RepID=UPI0003A75BA1|nr:2-dehydropantoate 2-reductase [Halopseudomonas pelagia]
MLHVLGAGSLGLLWAARLAVAGVDVRVILRDAQALQHWQAAGSSVLFEHAGRRCRVPLPAQLPDSQEQPIRALILATKAYSAESALHSVAKRLMPGASVLMLQNGMGSQQAASLAYPHQQVLYASVTDGVWMPAPRHIVWAGQGTTQVGDPDANPCPQWLEQLDREVIDWHWHPQILNTLWQKLAINCAINPYTALHDCCNGEVLERAGKQMAPLIHELHSLLALHIPGYRLTELSERIHQVIEHTANNSSSMRQDVHARRRTEISYITGFTCQAARQSGLETPVLDRLHEALKTHLATLGLPTD